MRIPPLVAVTHVVDVLQKAGMRPAVGGSGLLVALGLSTTANDWDLTVDAAPSTVTQALDAAGVSYREDTHESDMYGTDRRCVIDAGDHELDLLINFKLRGPTGIEVLPTRVSDHWRGLPLADPAVWARAYRLLGRTQKAELLEHWLSTRS